MQGVPPREYVSQKPVPIRYCDNCSWGELFTQNQLRTLFLTTNAPISPLTTTMKSDLLMVNPLTSIIVISISTNVPEANLLPSVVVALLTVMTLALLNVVLRVMVVPLAMVLRDMDLLDSTLTATSSLPVSKTKN